MTLRISWSSAGVPLPGTVWERETLRWAPGIATFVASGSRAEREEVIGEFSDFPTIIPGTRRMLIIAIKWSGLSG